MQKPAKSSNHSLVIFNTDTEPLSGATSPGNNGTEGVLCIPQRSSISGTSPSDCLVLYPGHYLGCLTPLQRSSRCIQQPQVNG